jgi:dTDP-glucose 4,6-dehydratase
MKLLVTGGAGFIGSSFLLYWAREHPEDELVNLDKLTYAGNLENLKSLEDNPKYSFMLGDITDPETVRIAAEGADIIVHFAAETHVDRSIEDASAFVRTNVLGTQVLLEEARRRSIRFHHISTDEVFGSLALESEEKFNEQTSYAPRSPYAASKAASDHLVRAYHETYGLRITISNCSNNFGPRQFPEKLIPLAVTNILEGKKVPVYGDGLNVRDWLHVDDHCRAIDIILQRGEIGESYCIGGMEEDIANITVVKEILTAMGKDESCIEYVTDRPGHDRRYAVDWNKIKTLGWEPQHDFSTWLRQTVHWYVENVAWRENVKRKSSKEK